MFNPISYLILSMEEGMEYASEDLMKFLKRAWEHETFWKWYYRLVIIAVIVGWGLILAGVLSPPI